MIVCTNQSLQPQSAPANRPPDKPPAAPWQAAALAFIERSERALWSSEGEKALAWLREQRGLKGATIRRFRLGYNPEDRAPAAGVWGNPSGCHGYFSIPRGIVIPCLIAGEVWYIKIRQLEGSPKYMHVRGGRPALFGADDLAGCDLVLLTEGELDAMLAWQEVGDTCGVATLGSASSKLDLATWGSYFTPARAVLVAYDLDPAGRKGIEDLSNLINGVKAPYIPQLRAGDKDLTDYYQAGGDLWGWLSFNLQGFGYLESLEDFAGDVGAKISHLPAIAEGAGSD